MAYNCYYLTHNLPPIHAILVWYTEELTRGSGMLRNGKIVFMKHAERNIPINSL